MKDKITARHDGHVHQQDDASEGDVAVLVDDGGHNVRPSGAAVIGQTESKSHAAERRTDDGCHERLPMQEHRMRKGRPENSRQDSQHHNAIDCADAELQP